MSGARMERIAPVRALEGLARINPKSDKPYLTPIMILASRKYYILMEAAKGKLNHEIIEPVDKSVDSDGRLVSHLTANDRFTRLRLKMPMDFSAMADLLYVKMPDRSLTQIWPNKTLRENSKVIIRDTLITKHNSHLGEREAKALTCGAGFSWGHLD